MATFGITPVTGYPLPPSDSFPQFIQFEGAGIDLGGPDADTVNFGAGLAATRGTGESSGVVTVVATAALLDVAQDGVSVGDAQQLNFAGGFTVTTGTGDSITVEPPADQTITLTGDVTGSGTSSFAATIANAAVTNAKSASMANATIKGRTTAGTGAPEDLTAAQAAAILQGNGTTTAGLCGFREIPQNSQSAGYVTVAADSGKHLLHPSGDASARTFTIASNASVPYPVGTAITFVNQTSQVLSIAITSDTLTLANSTTSGTRSLAQNGVATAIKITSTIWVISGSGLT